MAPHGWTLTSLPLRLQSDGHSCGIWVQEVASVWLKYVEEDPSQLSSFETFLRTQLHQRNVYDLRLPRDEKAARTAKASNLTFIRERRDALREELARAADMESLAWWQGSDCGKNKY